MHAAPAASPLPTWTRWPVLLDGGLATTLEAAGWELGDALWSARLLRDAPDAVTSAHLAFLRAGAQVCTTASYQASVDGFVRAGTSADEALALIGRSVALAREAVDRWRAETGATAPRWVAGSVGPVGAARANGSEYTGAYDLGRDGYRSFHAPRVEALVAAGADVLAVETQPRLDEALVALDLAAEAGASAWIAFTTRDGRSLPDGTPLLEAAAAAAERGAFAVGVNCCAPSAARVALPALPTGLPRVAYPNIGDRWDPGRGTWRPRESSAPESLGVELEGGCCGAAPNHIADLAARLGRR